MDNDIFFQISVDLVAMAGTHGLTEYVDNIFVPNKQAAAEYYGITATELVTAAYKIAEDVETKGYIVLPD